MGAVDRNVTIALIKLAKARVLDAQADKLRAEADKLVAEAEEALLSHDENDPDPPQITEFDQARARKLLRKAGARIK